MEGGQRANIYYVEEKYTLYTLYTTLQTEGLHEAPEEENSSDSMVGRVVKIFFFLSSY